MRPEKNIYIRDFREGIRRPVQIEDKKYQLGYRPPIASSVFHYELEFIHPSADGNSRMERPWQTLIMARWNLVFAINPVESMVLTHQQAYYDAITQSTNWGCCDVRRDGCSLLSGPACAKMEGQTND